MKSRLYLLRSIVLALVCFAPWAAYAAASKDDVIAEATGGAFKSVKGSYFDSACNEQLSYEGEVVDLNDDNKPEVFIAINGNCLGGMAGVHFDLMVKNAAGKWDRQISTPGMYVVQQAKSKGYRIIEVAGPGEPQLYSWDGLRYTKATGAKSAELSKSAADAASQGELKDRTDSLAKLVQGFDNKEFKAKNDRVDLISKALGILWLVCFLGSPVVAWFIWIKQGRPQKSWYKTKIAFLVTAGALVLVKVVEPKGPSADDRRKSEIATAIEDGTITQLAQAEIDIEKQQRAKAAAKAIEDQKKAADKLAAEKAAQRAASAKRADGLAVAIVQENIVSPGTFQLVDTKQHWSGSDKQGNPAYVVEVNFDAQNRLGGLLRSCMMTAFSIIGDQASYKRELGVQDCRQGISERELVEIIVPMNGFKS